MAVFSERKDKKNTLAFFCQPESEAKATPANQLTKVKVIMADRGTLSKQTLQR